MKKDNLTHDYLTIIKQINTTSSLNSNAPASVPSTTVKRVMIDQSCDIRGIERMSFGNDVVIQKDCWLNIAYNNPHSEPIISIGEGSNIGRRCIISAANSISIGSNVLIAPNVFIADTHHEYRHIGIPIMHQGISTQEARVVIGDGTWVGINTVIMGDVSIGKNCVIGANSVVNKNIPDYCIVAGNPARVVKMFDVETGTWLRVRNEEETTHILSKRGDLLNYVVPITKLTSLQVEVSSACNLQCQQCFNRIDGHHTGIFTRHLWDEKIKPLLGQLQDIHLVGIGEPLLCKDFFYFVEESVKNNVNVHTTSNLQLVNDEIAEKIVKSGVKELRFSCDGATPETYQGIHIKGSFDKLRESLSLINACKAKYNSIFPCLILNFGAMRRNIRELPLVVEFAKNSGVDLIIAYHDVIYDPSLKEESLFHEKELSDRKFKEAKQLADRIGIKLIYPGLFSKPIDYKSTTMYCQYPYRHLYIYSNGKVGPCCMDFPKRITLGTICDTTLEDIWNSAPILSLRKEMETYPSNTCNYCVSDCKMNISDPAYFFQFKGAEEYLKNLRL